MSKTKSFKASEAFMSGPEPTPTKTPKKKSEPKQTPAAETTGGEAEAYTAPEGYKLVKESKTARLQLLISPSTKKLLKQKSDATGRSVNDLVNEAIEKYIVMGG